MSDADECYLGFVANYFALSLELPLDLIDVVFSQFTRRIKNKWRVISSLCLHKIPFHVAPVQKSTLLQHYVFGRPQLLPAVLFNCVLIVREEELEVRYEKTTSVGVIDDNPGLFLKFLDTDIYQWTCMDGSVNDDSWFESIEQTHTFIGLCAKIADQCKGPLTRATRYQLKMRFINETSQDCLVAEFEVRPRRQPTWSMCRMMVYRNGTKEFTFEVPNENGGITRTAAQENEFIGQVVDLIKRT